MSFLRKTAQSSWIPMVGVLALVYAVFVGMIAFLQNSLIYFPQRESFDSLETRARDFGMEPWRSESAEPGDYHGWRMSVSVEKDPPANRIVAFHGNAGYALHRDYFVEGFRRLDHGALWEVFLFEYPGYGAREGRPGEERIVEAAKKAISALLEEDDRPVYLLGESLGGGVAALAAASMPDAISGLFLVTSFTSLADIGSHHYRWLPVRLLLRDHYDAEEALKHYGGPVAFLLAGQDQIVPDRYARKLYEGYDGPARLWIQQQAGHNTLNYLPRAEWWGEVSDFLLQRER